MKAAMCYFSGLHNCFIINAIRNNLGCPRIYIPVHSSIFNRGDSLMAEEKEYGLLIAAIVAIVSIVGLVILFSRGGV